MQYSKLLKVQQWITYFISSVISMTFVTGLIAYSWKTNKPSLNLRLNPDFSETDISGLSSQPIIY